jgi:hypothetical protein
MTMTKIEKIEQEIRRLTAAELAAFRDWFHNYDAATWDRRIEREITAGKLDQLAEEARADYAAGKSMPLEDALSEGTASGVSPRTIPDIILDIKARLGNPG